MSKCFGPRSFSQYTKQIIIDTKIIGDTRLHADCRVRKTDCSKSVKAGHGPALEQSLYSHSQSENDIALQILVKTTILFLQ